MREREDEGVKYGLVACKPELVSRHLCGLSRARLCTCRRLWSSPVHSLSRRALSPLPTMASVLRERSASASIPAYTADAPGHIAVPSLFAVSPETTAWLWTTVAIVAALLVLEQSVYRYKKAHLPGDKWTIPIIGKFADSMKPTMEGYMKQWNSGALSAISVFNM